MQLAPVDLLMYFYIVVAPHMLDILLVIVNAEVIDHKNNTLQHYSQKFSVWTLGAAQNPVCAVASAE